MVDKKTGVKPKKIEKELPKKKVVKKAEVVAEIATKGENEIEEKTTKAGKQRPKAIKESEEKEAKEERKASGKITEAKPKTTVRPARSRAERAGKKYREAAKLIAKTKLYSPGEALELVI